MLIYTVLALTAFAANSVLCRMALGQEHVDAISFTVIRLASGALVLFALLHLSIGLNSNNTEKTQNRSWLPASCLFLYAITFSIAYIHLDTATGALILFVSVQLVMISSSIWRGEKPGALEWLGLLLTLSGFVYLLLPQINTPSVMGFVLMTLSGVFWGLYTILGRGSSFPLQDTSVNFLKTWPFLLLLMPIGLIAGTYSLTLEGLLLAVSSGALASGLGYVLWYKALPYLSTTQAAVVQLLVPVIAAVGGVLFLAETLSQRLLFSAFLMLGGIAIVFLTHQVPDPLVPNDRNHDGQ